MRNLLFLALLLIFALNLQSQQTYLTREGKITFNASTPLEDIRAENQQVNAIWIPEEGALALLLLIEDFSFRSALMQEHFNENYMESERFPKATFQGTLSPMTLLSQSLPYSGTVEGELTIHGVSRRVSSQISLSQTSDGVRLETTFKVRPEDHKIEVPRLMFKKIAQEVEVDVTLLLKPETE